MKREKNVDGIFPLLTTDGSLSAKEVLRAYQYQPIYPEFRDASHPTTSKILSVFEGISSYQVRMGQMIKEFRDSLTQTQELILNMLLLSLDYYWGHSAANGEKSEKM